MRLPVSPAGGLQVILQRAVVKRRLIGGLGRAQRHGGPPQVGMEQNTCGVDDNRLFGFKHALQPRLTGGKQRFRLGQRPCAPDQALAHFLNLLSKRPGHQG